MIISVKNPAPAEQVPVVLNDEVTVMIDRDIVARYQASGPDWRAPQVQGYGTGLAAAYQRRSAGYRQSQTDGQPPAGAGCGVEKRDPGLSCQRSFAASVTPRHIKDVGAKAAGFKLKCGATSE